MGSGGTTALFSPGKILINAYKKFRYILTYYTLFLINDSILGTLLKIFSFYLGILGVVRLSLTGH